MVLSTSSDPARTWRPGPWALWSLLCASLLLLRVQGEKTAADYFVHSLPGAPDGPLLKMHAGHIEVNAEHNGHLFFWHFQNRHIANRQRTVIWLNGGPGCSSMDGALMEVGPYRLKDESTLRYNDGSWDEFANLLFVDQPVGTGFSYVNTDSFLHELKEMADHFVIFLEKFFALFPQYEHDDLYLAGESYAGQHIPYIAQAILDRNQKGATTRPWMLQGLLIGNGWVAPTEQYLSYLPKAYEAGLIQGGSAVAKQLESQMAVCTSRLNEAGGADRVEIAACEQVLTDLLKVARRDDVPTAPCVNMYDVRLTDSWPSCGMNWPPDLKLVTPYLRRPAVLQALHVDADKKTGWTECSGGVGSAFRAAKSKPSITLLPNLLSQMPIVLFSGDQDLICNHVGTEEFIHTMRWNGGTGFELSPGTWAPRRAWTFEGEPAGLYQHARNLTYILFYNASHMVPLDYPRRTRDMLDRFLGVDIADIGGRPADSRIDGATGRQVSVGAHPNSTRAQQHQKQKLHAATWKAYYRSGQIALAVVVLAVVAWLWFAWRQRRAARHRRDPGRGLYHGLFPSADALSSPHLPRRHRRRPRPAGTAAAHAPADDVEAAAAAAGGARELHELRVRTPPDDDDGGDGGGARGENPYVSGLGKEPTPHGHPAPPTARRKGEP
ncbi:MAG: Cell death protease [Phylliscum demangeonii]|nr:MAG: Cell death protease [Phylliscum demangeonii]